MVPDVLDFPGHIACDAESRSEIVVPIIVRGDVSTMSFRPLICWNVLTSAKTVAIIDIDCTQPSGFDDEDKKYLEQLAEILAEACDW